MAWRDQLMSFEEMRLGLVWVPIAEFAVFAGEYHFAERIWDRTMERARTIVLDNHRVSSARRGNRDEERFWEWWSTSGAQERESAYVEGPAWWMNEAFHRSGNVKALRASQGRERYEWRRLRWIADAVTGQGSVNRGPRTGR